MATKKTKKAAAKNRKKKSEKKSLSRKVIFVINCILLLMLAALIAYEAWNILKPHTAGAPERDEIADLIEKTLTPTKEQDALFIKEALNVDEMDDYGIYSIEKAINANNEKNPMPLEISWEEKIARIDNVDIKSEELYGFYEEPLPEQYEPLKTKKLFKSKQIKIAIVIDDMGISRKRTKDIASLEYPITAAFLTYAPALKEQIEWSKQAGQEIMAHIPMQPLASQNTSPDMLKVNMKSEDIAKNFVAMLAKFSSIKGVNNHMGSRFTQDNAGMEMVMKELKKKNMFFLDSKTTPKSVARNAAKKHAVAYIERDVFIDNEDNFLYIMKQLKLAESVAQKHGYAVAIGHPKSQTYLALKAWLPTLQAKGITLVPLSKIVDKSHK